MGDILEDISTMVGNGDNEYFHCAHTPKKLYADGMEHLRIECNANRILSAIDIFQHLHIPFDYIEA